MNKNTGNVIETRVEENAYCKTAGITGGTGFSANPYGDKNNIKDYGEPEIELIVNRSGDIVFEESKLKEIEPQITYIAPIDKNTNQYKVYGYSMYSGIDNVNISKFTREICNDMVNVFIKDNECKKTQFQNTKAKFNKIELALDHRNENGDIKSWDIKTNKPFQSNDNTGRFEITTNTNFDLDKDQVCVKNKLFENITITSNNNEIINPKDNLNTLTTNLIPSNRENDLQLFGSCERVSDYVTAITDEINVSHNGKADLGGELNTGVNSETRKVKLEFVDATVQSNHLYRYGGNKNVWIISHGLNDNSSGSFDEIAKTIQNKYPKDIVLKLDWSEASNNHYGCSPAKCVRSVYRAASWIHRVSEEVSIRMKNWGLNDGNNLYLVGHSLGSIMSGELSTKFPNKAKSLIALDPPSESSGFGTDFKVADNDVEKSTGYEINRKNFNEYAQFSRSFVGKNSIAGNQDFAKTAHEAVQINFDSLTDFGEEHSLVVKTFISMIRPKTSSDGRIGRYFLNPSINTNQGFLDLNDLYDNDVLNSKNIDGFNAILNSPKLKDEQIERYNKRGENHSIVVYKENKNKIYGTDQSDIITNFNDNPNEIYMSGGNDIYFEQKDSDHNTTIKDFGNGSDVLSFNRENIELSVYGDVINKKYTNKRPFLTDEIFHSSIKLEGDSGYIERAKEQINDPKSEIINKR